MNSLRVGCSGWSYASWRGVLYPAGAPSSRWLQRYCECFDTVEVNSTFYRLVDRNVVERWAGQSPPGFDFSVKVSRYLTHVRRLRDVGDGIERLHERIAPLERSARLGPLLWQLPESFRRDDLALAHALEQLPAGRHAFEFRHPSWFVPSVYSILRARGVALVIGDHPERSFQTLEATAPWRYVRFHYGRRGRRGNYSVGELRVWAARVAAWLAEGDVYAYFNNDWEAFAPRNALRFRELIRA